MFRMTSVFERPDTTNEFFYDVHNSNQLIIDLAHAYKSADGFIDVYFLKEQLKFTIYYEFETKEQFLSHIGSHQDKYLKRHEMIMEYCNSVNHKYSFYETNE